MSDFNSSLNKLLGERIKKSRLDLGMNQIELANAVGLGRTTITNIEVGRHQVPLSVLYKIARTLNIEIHSILPTYHEVGVEMKKEEHDSDDIFDEYLKSKQLDQKSLLNIQAILKNL